MYVPIGNVGNLPGYLPVGAVSGFTEIGALGRGFQGRQRRISNRELERQIEAQQRAQQNQMRQMEALRQAAQHQQMMQQATGGYNVASIPGVMPIQSPYAANIPGGNPFAPSPAAPPVTPPANARPVPLGNASAVQMAALAAGVPGTATLTFTSQDPFWLYDLSIECESDNLAYVESLTLGSQNIRAGSSGIQSVRYWSVTSFNQGKLQGYFINSTQSLVVVVRNVSTATNWVFGSCSGASVR